MGNSQCHLEGVRVRQALTGTGAACFPGLTGASVAGRILLMTPNRAPRAKRCLPGWLQWVGSAGQLWCPSPSPVSPHSSGCWLVWCWVLWELGVVEQGVCVGGEGGSHE